ncbi:hypothetical protein LXL04_030778 [Taraxacum kok-saghyz]
MNHKDCFTKNDLTKRSKAQSLQWGCKEVCTNIISGSDYPTAKLYLIEVFRVKQTLDKCSLSENDFIRDTVSKMKEKFDKYWG